MNTFADSVHRVAFDTSPTYTGAPPEWMNVGTEIITRTQQLGQSVIQGSTRLAASNLYGEGRCNNASHLSVLDFVGQRGAYGDQPDEFEFTGYGMLRTHGIGAREVSLEGYATGRAFGSTPFVETFQGHAVVSSTDSYAWPATTNLFRVRGVAAAKVARRRSRHYEPSRAYRAFKELGAWLDMSDEELAPIVKISRTTVSASWKHGTEPRKRAVARRLFQLHALVSALHHALGDDLTMWLGRGSPCPLRLLESEEYERFERLADEVIFPRADDPARRLDAAWSPHAIDVASADAPKTTRLKRAERVRSKRLGQ